MAGMTDNSGVEGWAGSRESLGSNTGPTAGSRCEFQLLTPIRSQQLISL